MESKEEFTIGDIDNIVPVVQNEVEEVTPKETVKQRSQKKNKPVLNCLRNERIIVRRIPQNVEKFSKNHVFFGNMAENAIRIFVVPKLQSGIYVNVLTDAEKAYLEEIMGLEYNAMSVYKRENNFWNENTEGSVASVTLHRQDNYLDLSNPSDYIRYKILLANKNIICPSLHELKEHPKSTYEFVIISTKEETDLASEGMTATMECYKEFGKIENDAETMRYIITKLEGKPLTKNTAISYLRVHINQLIQADSKLFLRTVKDESLSTKVMIEQAVEEGIIAKRNNRYFIRKDNTPMCGDNQEAVLEVAAEWLRLPKNQDLYFAIQEQVKQK